MPATVSERHHVTIRGRGDRAMVFAHGFGFDQQMWRRVAPAFEASHEVVLFDHIGCGRADAGAWSPRRHATLEGYAQDLLDILSALELKDVVYVGHSVGAMIGMLASITAPERFHRLVLIAPSPCYLNHPPHYHGGFEREDLDALTRLLDENMVDWADHIAPTVMGPQGSQTQVDEFRSSFSLADPLITRVFARAIFLSDHREQIAKVPVPSLVVQIEDDSIVPVAVGEYLRDHMPSATMKRLATQGHCPQLTHPEETIAAIRDYLDGTA